MTKKKTVLAILNEDEAKRLEAGRRLLGMTKRSLLLNTDYAKKKFEAWNIEIENQIQGILRCKACGARWSVNLPGENGKLSAGYWQCPTGCNKQETTK